jgi:hypothetical protein
VQREVDFIVQCESKYGYSPTGQTRHLDCNLQHKESYKLTFVESYMPPASKKEESI